MEVVDAGRMGHHLRFFRTDATGTSKLPGQASADLLLLVKLVGGPALSANLKFHAAAGSKP